MAQLALDDRWTITVRTETRRAAHEPRRCAHCHAREARYGFRDEEDGGPRYDRPRTLCFECFRVEISRRQRIAERMAAALAAAAASQARLPLEQTLESLHLRRRRAQIAARRALAG